MPAKTTRPILPLAIPTAVACAMCHAPIETIITARTDDQTTPHKLRIPASYYASQHGPLCAACWPTYAERNQLSLITAPVEPVCLISTAGRLVAIVPRRTS